MNSNYNGSIKRGFGRCEVVNETEAEQIIEYNKKLAQKESAKKHKIRCTIEEAMEKKKLNEELGIWEKLQ